MTTHFMGDNSPVETRHTAARDPMQRTLFDPETATTPEPTDSSTGSDEDFAELWRESAQSAAAACNDAHQENPDARPTAAADVQSQGRQPYWETSREQPEGWWKRVSRRNKGVVLAATALTAAGLAAIFAGGAGDSGKDRDPAVATAPEGDTPQADGYTWIDGQVGGGQQDNGLPTGTEGVPTDGEITGDGAPPEEISEGQEEVGGIDFRSPENRSLEFTPEYATSDDMEEVMTVLYGNIEKAISQRNPEYLNNYVYCSSVSESSQFWRNIVALAVNHYDIEITFTLESASDFGNGMQIIYVTQYASIGGDPPSVAKASFELVQESYGGINPETQQLESGHARCVQKELYQDP